MEPRRLLRILRSCKDLTQLRQTHLQIIIRGLIRSDALLSNLINAASALRSPDYAAQLFRNADAPPDVATHNFMIKCFNENRLPGVALSVYSSMWWVSSLLPNSFTFTFVLRSCELLGSSERGKEIHAHIVRLGCGSNLFVCNTLLDFYAKTCGGLRWARNVFDNMCERDVVSWNSMVGTYMACGERDKAMVLFETMPERNVVSWNLVITGLAKAGDMVLARLVFEKMAVKNEVSWNAILTGYVMSGDMVAAQAIFDLMDNKTVVSWTAMLSGHANTGNMESMGKLFAEMPVRYVASWNAMIAGYNENVQFGKALQTFRWMLIDGKSLPDEITLISVVSACAQSGALDHGNWVLSYIKKNRVHLSLPLGNALIDMFAKCGDVTSSDFVFRQMPNKCVITWTTMISGLGLNGRCKEALNLFEEMCKEGIKPDDVFFIAILTACTHGGFVNEGQQVFNRMVEEFGIKPTAKHYGCMVDLLGRAGKLIEAIQFIESMPEEPEAATWAALLSSCKTHGKRDLLDYVTDKIASLGQVDSAYQVLVSNSQASLGKWQNVVKARCKIRCEGLEKVPGCSSIQVGNKVHEFLAKDSKHKMRKEVYEVLSGLTALLRHVHHEELSF